MYLLTYLLTFLVASSEKCGETRDYMALDLATMYYDAVERGKFAGVDKNS